LRHSRKGGFERATRGNSRSISKKVDPLRFNYVDGRSRSIWKAVDQNQGNLLQRKKGSAPRGEVPLKGRRGQWRVTCWRQNRSVQSGNWRSLAETSARADPYTDVGDERMAGG